MFKSLSSAVLQMIDYMLPGFVFRSVSPDKSRDKDRDEHRDEKETTPREDTDKAAEEEQRSRSASPVPQDEERQTNGDDAE